MSGHRRDIALATVATFALRALLSAFMQSPFMFYDEGTGPTVARLLAGGDPEVYGTSGNPLLGIVLTPLAATLVWPEAFYRAALIVNAACFSLLLPVLYRIGRHSLGYEHRDALIGALLGSTVAPSIAFSVMVLPEALLALATAVSALAVDRAGRRGFAPGPTAAAVAATTVAFAAHRRGLILVVILALLLLDAGRAGTMDRRRCGIAVAALVVAVAGVAWLASVINDGIFVEPPASSGLATVIDGLGSPGLVARSIAGTSWYLVAGTLGVIPVALLALTRLSLTTPGAPMHRFVAGAFAGGLALSALFVSQIMANDGARVDSFAYGRYVEFVVPVVMLYAPAAWRHRPTLAAGFAVAYLALAVGTLVAARSYDRSYWLGPAAQHNQSALHWARHIESVLDPTALLLTVTVVMAALALVSLLAADTRLLLVPAMVGLVAGTTFVVDWARPASTEARDRLTVADHLRDGHAQDVAASIDRFDPTTLQLFAFWAPEVDFDPVEEVAALPADARWALQDATAEPPPERFRLALIDPPSGVALWQAEPAVQRPSSAPGS